MKSIILSIFISFVLCTSIFTQNISIHHAQAPIDCNECHICKNPTFEEPCLKLFPEFKREGLTVFDVASDAPEIIVIDTIKGIYSPTVFTHKLHAEMSYMAGGCQSCHHFNPPGKILRCIECHKPLTNREDLNKPSLKGAYHQQCLSCHREWSHSTNCTVCHPSEEKKNISDKSEFIGKTHPKIEVPGKLVYQTEEDDNPIVTFFHNQHNEMFKLECADCHNNESCTHCHDTIKNNSRTDKEAHENCIECHEKEIDDDCTKCHDKKERTPFTHGKTRFPLKKYHQNAECEDCHKTGKFTKLKRNCSSCHKKWKLNNFDHALTGLVLDENHIDNDCEDCHLNGNYSSKPSCEDCHDDINYPVQLPGKLK